MNWDQWIERHLKNLEATGHAGKTVSERRRMLGMFRKYAEEIGVDSPVKLTGSLVRAYLLHRRAVRNARGRPDRARTVNTHLLAVKRFLEFLARECVVPADLPKGIEYVRAPDALPKHVPSHEEILRMLGAIDSTSPVGLRDRAILELLYSTGMRRDELIHLTIADVDLRGLYVRIEKGKGGKGRVVPLGRPAAEWIEKYVVAARSILCEGASQPGDLLFVSKSGALLDGESVRQVVVKAAKLAGIERPMGPHALRRACATEMIRRNANLYHVKELLGHEDLESLKSYVRMTIVDLKEAHRKFHPREREDGHDPRRDEGPSVGCAPA